jgi:hypothetical protein
VTDRELGGLLADVVADAKTARTLAPAVRRACILVAGAALVALAAADATTADVTTDDAGAENLLDARAVAARLDIPLSRARELMKTGALPSIKVGKYRRVSPAALRQWMADQAEKPLPRKLSSTYNSRHGREGAPAAPRAARTDAGPIRRDARPPLELDRPPGTRGDRDQGIGGASRPPARRPGAVPPAPDAASDETRW